MPKHQGKRRPPVVLMRHPTVYAGESYPSRRKALAAKRAAGDAMTPTLRRKGDNRKDR